MTATSSLLSTSLHIFTAGGMIYGGIRAYTFKNLNPYAYINTLASVSLFHSAAPLLVAVILPTSASIGQLVGTYLWTYFFHSCLAYCAMKAGEQIGIAARPTDKEEIRNMPPDEKLQPESVKHELR